jgi:hypothetical protein
MALVPPSVGLVFSQAEINQALADIVTLIDADRVRLTTAESSLSTHGTQISANASSASAAQTAADAAMALVSEARARLQRLRIR